MLFFCRLYSFRWIQDIYTVRSRNLVSKQVFFHFCWKLQKSDVLALCLKSFSPFPIGVVFTLAAAASRGSTQRSLWVSWTPKNKGSRLSPGSPWAMDRGPRGGLVSSETQCLLSLPLTSLFFTAASLPGQTDSYQPQFTTGSSLKHYTSSAATDLLPKGAEKSLFGLYVGESKTQFFSCGAEKSFLLTLKLEVIVLNVE